jgi:RHS repeat-associated protein
MGAYRRASIRRAVFAVLVVLVTLGAVAAATDAAKRHAGKPVHTARPSHAAVVKADKPGGAPGKEIVSLRTRDSRTYEQPGGQTVARLFPGAVNYKNTHGRWAPISNKLVSAGGGAYRNAANAFFARLPGDLSQPVRFSAGGSWVTFALRGAHGSGSVSGSTDRFANAFPGVTDSFAVQNDRLSESLTLGGPKAQSSFTYDVANSAGLRARKARDGGIDFRDRRGRVVFRFLAPYMFDRAGATSAKVSLSLSRHAGRLAVALKPNAKWLSSKARQWPVTIDPDIQFPSNGSTRFHGNTQACTLTGGSSANTSSCSGQTVSAGYDGTKASRALFKFDLSTIPNTSYVEAATFGDYSQSRTASVDTNLEVHGLTRSWTTAATWNKYDGTNAWTSPGGDFNSAADASNTYWASDGSPTWVVIPGLQKLVQSWVDGTQTNNGIAVKEASPETTNNVISLNTAAYPDGNFWPYMDVWYRSRTGSLPFYTFESQKLNDRMGIKVNVGSGNLELNANDVHFNGRNGSDLGITRTYNAQREYYVDFTNRWMMDPGRGVEIKRFDNGDVAFCGPDGASEMFNKSGTSWTSPPGVDATYEEGSFTASNGQSYPQRLTFHGSGEKLYFDGNTFAGADDPLQREEDRSGNGISISYTDRVDGDLGVSSITDSQGRTFSFTRDPTTGGITKITDDKDSRTWQYTYDAADTWDLKTFTDPNGKITNYGYDANGNLNQITDPRGNLTKITYDGKRGKVTQVQRYTDVNHTVGPKWTFSYSNTAGSNCTGVSGFWGQTVVTDPDGNAGASGHTTTYCYDKSLRVLKTTDGNGHNRSSTYNSNGDVLSYTSATSAAYGYAYDMTDNRPLTASDPKSDGTSGGLNTTLAYDDTNHGLLTDPVHWLPHTSTDSQGNTQTYSYDSAGRVTGVDNGLTPPTGQAHNLVITPNSDGTVASTKDGDGNQTSYSYDSSGDLIGTSQPTKSGTNVNESFTHNSNGQLATATDGRGFKATYTYDGLDRITNIQYSQNGTNTSSVAYTDDENGNILSRTDGTGQTTYTYDRVNRLTQESLPGSRTNTYTYDDSGNLKTLVDAGGTTTYAYDGANNVCWVLSGSSANACASVPSGATSFTYYNDNERKDTNYPNGVKMTGTFDGPGRMTEIKAVKTSTSTVLTDFNYSYTIPSGQCGKTSSTPSNAVYSVTDKSGVTTSYCYDQLNRVLSATQPTGTGNHSYSYTYDGAGNVLSSTKDGVTTSYGYGANELCWSFIGTPSSNACGTVPTGATTYSYDSSLNLTSSTAGLSLSYNDKNQTTSMTDLSGGSSSGTIAYAGPNQFERTGYGSTALTNNVLGVGVEKTGTSSTYYTRDNHGTLISEKLPTGSTYYYTFDRLGSVAALVNSSGSVSNSYTYGPYGTTSVNGTIANPWRYAGAYQDASGFYKMGLRYYRPELARWTQADPAQQTCDSTDGNVFGYTDEDPVNGTDPSGAITSSIRGFIRCVARHAGAHISVECASSCETCSGFVLHPLSIPLAATIICGQCGACLKRAHAGKWFHFCSELHF